MDSLGKCPGRQGDQRESGTGAAPCGRRTAWGVGPPVPGEILHPVRAAASWRPACTEILDSRVKAYLDLCCLERPFDSQEHPLVRMETEAVVALPGAPADRLHLVRSAAHALDNTFNTVVSRRDAVSQWLAQAPLGRPSTWCHNRVRSIILNCGGSGRARNPRSAGAAVGRSPNSYTRRVTSRASDRVRSSLRS